MSTASEAGVTTTELTAADTGATGEAASTVEQQSPQSAEQPAEQSQSTGDQAQATGDEPPAKTALEAVMRVMDKNRADDAADQKAREVAAGEQKQPAATDDDGQGDPDDKDLTGYIDKDEWAALPQKTQKRITQFREKVRTLEGRLEEVAPKVQTFDHLTGYLQASGISREEFANGLELIRLVRQDPIEAFKRLQPIMQDLQTQVGEVLPEDLQNAVDDGRLTEEYARELARQRSAASLREQQLRMRDEAAEREAAVGRAQAAHQAVVNGIAAWENKWKTTDPDYAKKSPMVFERMMVLMQTHGRPRTPADAVKIAEQAKKDVEERLKTIAPPPRAKNPVVQNGAAVQTSKQPASALEAAEQALRRMRQG